jgi:anti-sigma B factor antagonist
VSAPETRREGFVLSAETKGDIQLVSLSGSASMEHTDDLRQRLLELADGQSPRIALDLSGLIFVNSAALGAFIAAHRRCQQRGGELCFINPRDAVTQVLRVTNLDRLISIFPDLKAAQAALSKSKSR